MYPRFFRKGKGYFITRAKELPKGCLISERFFHFGFISKNNVPDHYPEYYPLLKTEYAHDTDCAYFLEDQAKLKKTF